MSVIETEGMDLMDDGPVAAEVETTAEATGEDAMPEDATAPVSQTEKAPRLLPQKRPRWGDKAFEDITMGNIEEMVRKCNSYENKLEATADVSVPAIKSAIAKQLLAQMIYVFAWNDELKESGREISAYIPNVSPEVLKALGGDTATTTKKIATRFFDSIPSKSVPPATSKKQKPHGTGLVLSPTFTLKWVKTTRELQVKAAYRFGISERKAKGRGRAKANEDGAVQDGADPALEEDVESEDEEDNSKGTEAAGEESVMASCQGGA